MDEIRNQLDSILTEGWRRVERVAILPTTRKRASKRTPPAPMRTVKALRAALHYPQRDERDQLLRYGQTITHFDSYNENLDV